MQPINSHYQAVYNEGKQSNDEASDCESSYYSDEAELSSGGDSVEYRTCRKKQNRASTSVPRRYKIYNPSGYLTGGANVRIRKRDSKSTRIYRCMNCNRTYNKSELQSSMMIVQEKGDDVIIVCCPGSVSSELCPPIDANLGARRTRPSLSVIFPGQNRGDPQPVAGALVTDMPHKRMAEPELVHPANKRRRIYGQRGELFHEMTLAQNTTKPDEQLLQRVKDILKTKSKSQKELAREVKVSQTKLSQYLNRGYRTKGWQSLEEKLQVWVNKNIADRGILPATEAAEILPIPLDPPKMPPTQVYMQHSFTPDNAQEYYQAMSEHQQMQNEAQFSLGDYGFTNTSVNNTGVSIEMNPENHSVECKINLRFLTTSRSRSTLIEAYYTKIPRGKNGILTRDMSKETTEPATSIISISNEDTNNMSQHKAFALVLVTVLICMTSVMAKGTVVYPPGTNYEFGTPYMTNSFVGSPPTEFTLTANLTIIDGNYCGPFEAAGQWVVVSLGPCSIKDKVQRAVESGAAGIIVHLYERALGHHSRIPISDTVITLPVVNIIFNDFLALGGMLQNGTVIVEISPDPSEFHALVFNTGWFITLNIFFGLVYLFLLALVIRKFVLKVRTSGFILNISFVYLMLQTVFCTLMIVRWLDPLNARGFYILEIDQFIEAAPVSWAFAALLLMAFFWFEVINQFANTKVTPFLSRKLQIPFWVATACIVSLPIASSIVIYFTFEPYIALLCVTLVGGAVVAVFYVIVAVKVMQVLNRSRKVNVDKRSRIRSLEKSRLSVIISTVFACTYPVISFSLRYTFININAYIGVATLLEESLFLGVIVAMQVSFMPNKSIGHSSSSNKTGPNGQTNTLGPFSTSTQSEDNNM